MKHRALFPRLYAFALTAFTAFVLLDAFVIPQSYSVVKTPAVTQGNTTNAASDPTTTANTEKAAVTATTYDNGSTKITLSTYREYDTDIYVADVTLSGADALKTAFANNTYGKNVTQTTSAMAQAQNAVLAINGDYYGARSGYVIRNGVLYRDTAASAKQQDLVIYADGTMEIVQEGDVTAQALLDKGAQQVLSFGPGLLTDGTVTVDETTEVDKARTSNPRTAIGQVDGLHYVFVVADGRTSASAGLSLYQLAQFMQGLGVRTAYNLDGGGSSTMVFGGAVVNQPTTGGDRISERKVSDIVYIG